MTNNPAKADALRAGGVEVAERVPTPTVVTPENLRYLRTKRDRMGHLLEGLDDAADDQAARSANGAPGNDDDGNGDYVYRKTGGEGVDLTFEKVYVTTGEKNDYYIEISSANLSEGDVIRASSDLTQGLETSETTSSDMGFMMGGGMGGMQMTETTGGGNMPQGGGAPEGNYAEYTFEG